MFYSLSDHHVEIHIKLHEIILKSDFIYFYVSTDNWSHFKLNFIELQAESELKY
jgi:hypothetical protein